MLVLTRNKDESVMIGDDIEVHVVDVRGDKVRLGFVAPRSVSVHRREIYEQIRDENRSAARVLPADVAPILPAPRTQSPPTRLAVLISGAGTTLRNLIDRIAAGRLPARIERVIASRADAGGIAHARAAGIEVQVVERREFGDVASFARAVFERIGEVDLVCLAGWLSLLEVPAAYAGRVMNIHPALLPSFGGKGMYGLRVHEAVIASGCRISGCTVHFVDENYDTGPIILQRPCTVRDDDTPQTLAARVFEEEKQAYPQAITLFHQKRLRIVGRRVMISPAN